MSPARLRSSDCIATRSNAKSATTRKPDRMARLYSNENFPLPVALELRRLGHDVLTVQEAGNAGQRIPDDEVLRFATSEARAVLTINRRHFVKLHRDQPDDEG